MRLVFISVTQQRVLFSEVEGLCWYHLKGYFFQSLKVFYLIIVILFPQCVLLICIVYFRHPGYIYGVQRAT